MASYNEDFSGGLVTIRDASQLKPGELVITDDLIYKAADLGLHSAYGRTKFNATPLSSAVTGLVFCAFDSGSDVLIAQSGTTYQRAVVGLTGTFASVATGITAGNTLDAVHYNNRYVLLNGANNNLVLKPDGTTRGHGLSPVVKTPGLQLETGTWPLGSAGVPYYYEYWTTELLQDGTTWVESDATTAAVGTIYVDAATKGVRVTRPPLANSTATHWAVYRSNLKTTPTAQNYPIGTRIAGPLPIATSDFLDGTSTSTTVLTPTVVNDVDAKFTNPDFSRVVDGSTATATAVTYVNIGRLDYSNFGFSTLLDPVAGIIVTAKFSLTAGASATVQISQDNGATWGYARTLPYNQNTGGLQTVTVGTSSDINSWAGLVAASGFINANFKLRLTFQALPLVGTSIAVDGVTVQIYYNGTPVSTPVNFPAISVILNGQISSVGLGGLPPIASTADIFEGSMVMNSTAEPNAVYYSAAGNIDAVPSLYRLTFDTKERDVVTCVRCIGSMCMIFLSNQTWRVNYLPRAQDAEFDRGRSVEQVDSVQGCVGPRAATRFHMNGVGEMLAFMAYNRLCMTDGFHTFSLSDDIDWTTTADATQLSKSQLINDPVTQNLILYYTATDTTTKKAMYFNYHAMHLKDGRLKASGPVNVDGRGACGAALDDGSRRIYTGAASGYVYVEHNGTTDASGTGIAPHLRTRELYLSGAGGEWRCLAAHLHHTSGSTHTLTFGGFVAKTNAALRTIASKTLSTIARGLVRLVYNQGGEGIAFDISVAAATAALSFNYLAIDGEDFGVEDSDA